MEIIHQDNNETVYQLQNNSLKTWVCLLELEEKHLGKIIKTLMIGTTLFVSVSN